MKHTFIHILLSLHLAFAAERPAGPERFEHSDEALRLFTCVPAGGDITAGTEQREQFGYGRAKEPLRFVRDYTDKAANDFSIRFDAPGTDDAKLIGFTPGPWIDDWKVDGNAVLHLQLKTTAAGVPVKLALLDHAGKRALCELSAFKADGTWQAVQTPLKDFKPEQGFDFAGGLVGCEVHLDFPKDARIWFDDIYFTTASPGGVLGVTEKPIAQRIAETRLTKRLGAPCEPKVVPHRPRAVDRQGHLCLYGGCGRDHGAQGLGFHSQRQCLRRGASRHD